MVIAGWILFGCQYFIIQASLLLLAILKSPTFNGFETLRSFNGLPLGGDLCKPVDNASSLRSPITSMNETDITCVYSAQWCPLQPILGKNRKIILPSKETWIRCMIYMFSSVYRCVFDYLFWKIHFKSQITLTFQAFRTGMYWTMG